jgi:hypothetical protein
MSGQFWVVANCELDWQQLLVSSNNSGTQQQQCTSLCLLPYLLQVHIHLVPLLNAEVTQPAAHDWYK